MGLVCPRSGAARISYPVLLGPCCVLRGQLTVQDPGDSTVSVDLAYPEAAHFISELAAEMVTITDQKKKG